MNAEARPDLLEETKGEQTARTGEGTLSLAAVFCNGAMVAKRFTAGIAGRPGVATRESRRELCVCRVQ